MVQPFFVCIHIFRGAKLLFLLSYVNLLTELRYNCQKEQEQKTRTLAKSLKVDFKAKRS